MPTLEASLDWGLNKGWRNEYISPILSLRKEIAYVAHVYLWCQGNNNNCLITPSRLKGLWREIVATFNAFTVFYIRQLDMTNVHILLNSKFLKLSVFEDQGDLWMKFDDCNISSDTYTMTLHRKRPSACSGRWLFFVILKQADRWRKADHIFDGLQAYIIRYRPAIATASRPLAYLLSVANWV